MRKPQVAVKTMSITQPGGMFTPARRYTVLHAATIMNSLHAIKDLANEEHTRENLQKLIDMISDANTTV